MRKKPGLNPFPTDWMHLLPLCALSYTSFRVCARSGDTTFEVGARHQRKGPILSIKSPIHVVFVSITAYPLEFLFLTSSITPGYGSTGCLL